MTIQCSIRVPPTYEAHLEGRACSAGSC